MQAAVRRPQTSSAKLICRSATGTTRIWVGASQVGNEGISWTAAFSSSAQITRSIDPVGEQWRIGGWISTPSGVWYLISKRSALSTSIWTVGFSIGLPWASIAARSAFAIQ